MTDAQIYFLLFLATIGVILIISLIVDMITKYKKATKHIRILKHWLYTHDLNVAGFDLSQVPVELEHRLHDPNRHPHYPRYFKFKVNNDRTFLALSDHSNDYEFGRVVFNRNQLTELIVILSGMRNGMVDNDRR